MDIIHHNGLDALIEFSSHIISYGLRYTENIDAICS